MSRFTSLLVGSLVLSQIVLPISVDAAYSQKTTKVTNFTLPASFFLPVTAKPTAKPTTTPTSTPRPTPQIVLPVVTTFPLLVTPPVTPEPTVTATPTATPVVTKAPVKEAVLPQDKKDTIKRFYESMQTKLSDLNEKLSNLAARMDSKVADLKSKKISTTAIEKALNAAKAKIAQAKADLAGAAKKANALLDSADRKVAFDALKAAILDVQENLKTAHELLTEAANQLKTAYQALLPTNAN